MAETRWEKTNNIYAYAPKFKIICRYCNVPLELRYSIIDDSMKVTMKYKCPKCGWFSGFEIDDDREYQKKIFEMRGGVYTITPTVAEYMENEAIAKQLAGLGYWGGRDPEEK